MLELEIINHQKETRNILVEGNYVISESRIDDISKQEKKEAYYKKKHEKAG